MEINFVTLYIFKSFLIFSFFLLTFTKINLQCCFKRHRGFPVEIPNQLPVVEIPLEDAELRLGHAAIQLGLHLAHAAEHVRIRPESIG